MLMEATEHVSRDIHDDIGVISTFNKIQRSLNEIRGQLDDVDLDTFFKKSGIRKYFTSDDKGDAYPLNNCRGDLLAEFREALQLIYCKENNIKDHESLSDISFDRLSNNGKKVLEDFEKFLKKTFPLLKNLMSSDSIYENLLEFTTKNLSFFNKLIRERGWKIGEAFDAVTAAYSFVKNYNGESEDLLEDLKSYQKFFSSLVPFSKLSQEQENEHAYRRWKIRGKNDQEIVISDFQKERVITYDEWKIWLKTLTSQYLFLNTDNSGLLLNDLSYVYCDMVMTPNRSESYLNHSDIIQLFTQYCSYLEKQWEQNSQNGTPISLFSEQEVTDNNRRKRIVRSILDGKWYDIFDRVTSVNPEDFLHQRLTAVDRNPNCNMTIGELLVQVYPNQEITSFEEILKDLTFKKLFDLSVIIDTPDGKSRCNGYYHTSRYLVKPKIPIQFNGEEFDSIEFRIHGADRFSNISNTTFLPCIKITLIQDDGTPGYNYCLFTKSGVHQSGWYSVNEVNKNNIILLGASHILFTPKEDICGNEC